ncbi:MAG: hypothetical protein ACTHWH_06035 [Marinobacter sp.]
MTEITKKTKTAQAANGGVAIALATLMAWGASEAGVSMPPEVVAAVGVVIGWAFARFAK